MKFFQKTVLTLSLCCLSFHVWGAERRTLPQRIEEFTKQYRGVPVPEKGVRHLQPLPQEAKKILLGVPSTAVVAEEVKQETPEGASAATATPLDESFPQHFQGALDDPLTNGMDMLTCFLKSAISRTPDWTPDDRILMKFLRTSEALNFLSLDPDVYTPRNSRRLLESIFLASHGGLKLESLGEEILFFPVCTDKLFPPALLTRWATQNVFLVGVPTKEGKVHNWSLSPLGQMIHDIAHGVLAIHGKTKRFELDYNSVFNHPQFPMRDLSRRETFQKDLISFWRQKNTAFEQALVGCLDHLEKNYQKVALAGLFFAVHEEGIAGWPAPGGMGGDFLQTLGSFLGQAQTAFSAYYTEDPFQTSPKDGKPKNDFVPFELRSSFGMTEKTLAEMRPDGPVLEIKLADGSSNWSRFFSTQQWLVKDSGDAQKMLKWAGLSLLTASPITEASDEAALKTYIQKTLEGIQYTLQVAQSELIDFIASEEGSQIDQIFTNRIKEAQRTFLGQTKDLVGDQALIQAIATGNIRPKPEPHTHG